MSDFQYVAELNATPEHARNKLTPQYYLAELARPEEMQVTVSQQDFELSLGELVPSVSEAGKLHCTDFLFKISMLKHPLYLYSLRNAPLQGRSGKKLFDDELWKRNANIVCIATATV